MIRVNILERLRISYIQESEILRDLRKHFRVQLSVLLSIASVFFLILAANIIKIPETCKEKPENLQKVFGCKYDTME